jgi:phage major head subunit gpT-like protein
MNLSEIKLTPRKFEDISAIEYSLYTCPLISWPNMKALVAEFRGECGHGSGSNADAAFMAGIVKAAQEAWPAAALILDWRQLKYEWGDEIVKPIDALGTRRVGDKSINAPAAVIISDLNRVGLTSLVKQEMGENPDELLFNSLEEALAAVDKQAHRIYETP